jgi:hypothetical protein
MELAMPVNPEPIQPKVVRLDGPGPFATPPLIGGPNLIPAGAPKLNCP